MLPPSDLHFINSLSGDIETEITQVLSTPVGLSIFEQHRNFFSDPLLRLRTKPLAPHTHQTNPKVLPFPPSNDTMSGASRQQTPRCSYIGYVLICGHIHFKILHDCASCLQQLQQIQYSPEAAYSFNWPAACRPTLGVNVHLLRVPPPQVCQSCQQQGFRWMGSTGFYS